MAAKQSRKSAGTVNPPVSAKKKVAAKPKPQSGGEKKAFERMVVALFSFPFMAQWYYVNGSGGSRKSRADEVWQDLAQLEAKYQGLLRRTEYEDPVCPEDWVECDDCCLPPGSQCF
jgi:hypothetical protein